MNIEPGTSFGTVGEKEIDFSTAQLVETSDSFRRWFFSQANSAIGLGEFIGGVIHASYAGEGDPTNTVAPNRSVVKPSRPQLRLVQ